MDLTIGTCKPFWHSLLPDEKPVHLNSTPNSELRKFISEHQTQCGKIKSINCCCLCTDSKCLRAENHTFPEACTKSLGSKSVCSAESEPKPKYECTGVVCICKNVSPCILIIGCGLTGASCALKLAQLGARNVIVVDQRGIGDGATGRNGGHQWPEIRKDYSKEDSDVAAICSEIEMLDVERVRTFCQNLTEEEKQAVDLHVTGGLSLALYENEVPFFEDFVKEVKVHRVDAVGVAFINSTLLKQQEYSGFSREVVGAVRMPQPAQFVPAQLVLAIVKKATQLGVQFFTNTRVKRIVKYHDSVLEKNDETRWRVELEDLSTSVTSCIVASKILHATNGYGLNLLPETIKSNMTPYRGQIISAKASKSDIEKSIVYECVEGSHEEYLIKRVKDNVIIFGGCRHAANELGLNVVDDSTVENSVTEELVRQLDRLLRQPKDCDNGIDDAKQEKINEHFEITHAWSGIMCKSRDGQPVVGEIPESKGQYVAIGYNGHGMVRAFSCGIHVAELILSRDISCPNIAKVFDIGRFIDFD